MPAKADLHIHSTASDGRMSPQEVVAVADSFPLKTIALTDHDTIKGIVPAKEAAAGLEIAIMNGVEVTVCFNHREIHLLAYDFSLDDDGLNKCLNDHKKARIERAKVIIELLKKEGLQVTIDEVRAEAVSQNVCRPHIAAVLVSKGYVATQREAFIRYLSDKQLGEMKDFYHRLEEVIECVKQAGGVAVIAHPGRLYKNNLLNEIIALGIDGIEAIHPAHSYSIQKQLEQLARKHNLLITGGSDFHGQRKEYYRNFGTVGIHKDWIEKIRQLAGHRKK